MAQSYHGRGGVLRIYERGLASGTGYLEIPFVQMDLTAPIAKPRPVDPIISFVGGYKHVPDSPEYEKGFYEGLPFSFSCTIDDQVNREKLLQALCNVPLGTQWKVGTQTWNSTKGMGSIALPDGTFYATQPFFDTKKVSVNMEVVWTALSGTTATFGYQWKEIYTPPQTIEIHESPDAVTLAVQGLIYGDIGSIAAFTPGTAA